MTVAAGAPARIAVVDDDRAARDYLADTLTRAGFDVRVAESGLRLVATLQVDRPDLIVLDINMSWIDGFELCRALKRNRQWGDIPVVFVSGRSSEADRAAGIAAGAVGFLPKPIDGRTLVATVRKLLQDKRPP
ncbi:MAG: response regulator [Kofleriaceae bacterium]